MSSSQVVGLTSRGFASGLTRVTHVPRLRRNFRVVLHLPIGIQPHAPWTAHPQTSKIPGGPIVITELILGFLLNSTFIEQRG